MAEVDQAFTDDELTGAGLAADPEAGVAVPIGELWAPKGGRASASGCPAGVCPPLIGLSRLLHDRRRRIVLLAAGLVAGFGGA